MASELHGAWKAVCGEWLSSAHYAILMMLIILTVNYQSRNVSLYFHGRLKVSLELFFAYPQVVLSYKDKILRIVGKMGWITN